MQAPFGARSDVGNEKERSTQCFGGSEREVLAFHQQFWFFFLVRQQPAQPPRTVALSFLRGRPGA